MRIPQEEVEGVLRAVLSPLGFADADAEECARLFADANRDGVPSHGLNRFPRFVRTVREGIVDPRARPVRLAAAGVLERWDGARGPGNLNARRSMARAVELARAGGVGCVSLGNTNHWMRAGAFGWQAAEAGVIGICWTNTMPNLPPWGAAEPRLGNNPIVLAVPREGGRHVVLDMAMSQFSFGALEGYRRRGEALPVPGGFDREGRLTTDAGAIEASLRALPIGYWKGSGLALLLDLIASTLAGGGGTHQVPPDPERETGLSQLFLAIDPAGVLGAGVAGEVADAILAHFRGPEGEAVRYPGERALRLREESRREGIEVDPAVWKEVRLLAASR
jgi:3-dehydro-L-gulonate 2-dehydrogenase